MSSPSQCFFSLMYLPTCLLCFFPGKNKFYLDILTARENYQTWYDICYLFITFYILLLLVFSILKLIFARVLQPHLMNLTSVIPSGFGSSFLFFFQQSCCSLHKTLQSHLISWCGNLVQTHSFRRVIGTSLNTLWKLCLYAKFPHQEFRWS